jgi:hypothetical protein
MKNAKKEIVVLDSREEHPYILENIWYARGTGSIILKTVLSRRDKAENDGSGSPQKCCYVLPEKRFLIQLTYQKGQPENV